MSKTICSPYRPGSTLFSRKTKGVFTCSKIISIVTNDNTCKYSGNTHEHWPNAWKMQFASIVTLLVNFEAILMYFKACGRSLLWNWLLKLIFTENLFKIASKLTSIVAILANIVLAGEHTFQVWLNTREYYHNTYQYWHDTCKCKAGENNPVFTSIPSIGQSGSVSAKLAHFTKCFH